MEKRLLKMSDNEVMQSFCNALNDWREGLKKVSYTDIMTCFSFVAFTFVQDILESTGMVVSQMKDRILEDMHAYLDMAGNSALENLLEDLREEGKDNGLTAEVADAVDADAEEVSSADGPAPDNGYFEKFEDD